MEILGSASKGPSRAVAPPPRRPGGYEGSWRLTVPSLDCSVPGTRRAVRELIARQGVPICPDLLHGLLLIVSELVTNAVQHAALLSPEVGVEVSIGPAWVRVAVEDSHPYRPRPMEVGDECTGGRGLLLVQAVVEEAGGCHDVEHTAGGGKVVWAALPLTSPQRGR